MIEEKKDLSEEELFYRFNKFIFPELKMEIFNEYIFTNSLVFNESCRFEGDVYFFNSIFECEVYFDNCNIKGKVNFVKCLFNNRFNFNNMKLKKEINFRFANFKSKVKIQLCDINDVDFYNTKFQDLADFYQTKFFNVNFERTDFEKIAVFSEVEFYCDVDFKYTKFLGKVIFRDTVITGKLNLRDTIFDDDANFLDITSKKRIKDKDINDFIGETKDIKVKNRETARVIKNFFDNQNNTIEANKFYKLEMRERRKEFNSIEEKNDNHIFEKFIFIAHEIFSNHSQSWFLVIFWIIYFTFMYSLIFCLFIKEHLPNDIENILLKNELLIELSIALVIVYYLIVFLFILVQKLHISGVLISVTILLYITYINVTSDLLLRTFSNNLNPFSIMTGNSELNLLTFVYKIIIGYLIYQLIISIRQNTRRK